MGTGTKRALPQREKQAMGSAASSKDTVAVGAFNTFAPKEAKGGCDVNAARTALVMIEFQNEFTTDGGKLYPAVKECMSSTGMLAKAKALAETVRGAGGKVFHVPIMFKADASDNPNKGTWNAEFSAEVAPQDGDVVIKGK